MNSPATRGPSRHRCRWCIFPSLLVTISLFFPATVHAAGGAEIAASFPRGYVTAMVHAQGLSHFALHSSGIQRTLAAPYSPSTVVIVGVEWGNDVEVFGRNGYKVIGIEPIPTFVDHVRNKVKKNPEWNVSILPYAVGNPDHSTTKANISYENHGKTFQEVVPLKRLDDVISEELALLSVDIQGDEISVLKGAEKLLKSGNVSTLWVEAIACNDRIVEVMEFLDKHDYVLLDFVPWGKHKDDAGSNTVPKSMHSFVFDRKRPGKFEKYSEWLCKTKEKEFVWLQTDFLAIQRDVFEDVLSMMLNLGEHGCDLDDSNCVLRDMLHNSPQYGRDATIIEEEDLTFPEEARNDKKKQVPSAGGADDKEEDIRKEELEGEHAIDEEEDMKIEHDMMHDDGDGGDEMYSAHYKAHDAYAEKEDL